MATERSAPLLLLIGLALLTSCTTTQRELTLEARPLSDHTWYVAGRIDEHSILRRETLRRLTADTTGRYRFGELFGRQREGEVILYWAADLMWSPDGQLAAYLTNRESVLDGTRGQSLWIVDVTSGVERPLLADPGRSYRHVGWLGGDLLFLGNAAPGVWAVHPRTGVRRLVSDGYVTATTRNGSAVAIARGDSVIVSTLRDSIALPAPPPNHRYASDGEFSPNGERIAIGLSDGRGGSQMRVFELSSRRSATFAYPDSLSPTHRPIWRPNHPDERQRHRQPQALLVKVSN